MDEVTEHSTGKAGVIVKDSRVFLLRGKGVDLLDPDACHFTQRAGIAAKVYIV